MSHTIVIFGASGDLTSRKLVPALYELFQKKRLPAGARVVGFSRTPFSHDAWREKLAESTAQFTGDFEASVWEDFAKSIYYQPGDLERPEDAVELGRFLDELDAGAAAERIYYLATAPQFYASAIATIGQAGLADESRGARRIVIEKPFGSDLASARELNAAAHRVFSERQIFRIDHYLGKETVQNLFVLRFANTIFEPLWNRNYIDHVQITVAEEGTVGRRAGYYDSAGILRDMFQNHLLQLLMVTAMEPPSRFEADAVRDEKVKVLHAMRPKSVEDVAADTIRAQYRAYHGEPGVPPDSHTATFGAVKLWIDNWRWQDVPFYLRSGKGMSCRTTQIVIQFRQPPHMIFAAEPCGTREANRLVIQVQPAEGIQLHLQTKVPDAGMQLRLTDLAFSFQKKFAGQMPEAYQRLLLDVLSGDASLFARADEVELAWRIIDPIQAAWDHADVPALAPYKAGGWGPTASTEWMLRQGREWFDVCPILS
ncbi:MAG: glucose-6-phosphate dehydrogenase [Pirellulales bacterium]